MPRYDVSGEAYVYDSDGNPYWGIYGAAGLLVYHPSRGVLLQHRAAWTDHGGTWGLPGGARHRGESAWDAAVREAYEEAGVRKKDFVFKDSYIVEYGDGIWSYTTVMAEATRNFEPVVRDDESKALEWVALADVENLQLHPGLASSWAILKERFMSLRG